MKSTLLNQTRRDLRFWLCILFGMAVLTNLMCVAIYGPPQIGLPSFSGNAMGLLAGLGLYFGLGALVCDLAGFSSARSLARVRVICAFFGLASYAYIVFGEQSAVKDPVVNALIILAPFGVWRCAVLLIDFSKNKFRLQSLSDENVIFVQLCLMVQLLGSATSSALAVTKALLPATYDYHVYRMDAAFGGLANWCARFLDLGSPELQAITLLGYGILVLVFYVVLGLCMRDGRLHQFNVLRTFIVPFILASFCYALVPVSGPIYAFFDGRFPHELPLVSSVPAANVVLPPYPRNGMPSFHLTGAILVWMLSAGLTRKIAFYFSSAMVICVAWATMALGEHYALDLIVALPFALCLGWVLINPASELSKNPKIRLCVWLSGLTFGAWMLGIALKPLWLSENLSVVLFLSLWSVAISVVLTVCYIKKVWVLQHKVEVEQKTVETPSPERPGTPVWIVGLFVASGFAGLVYEVVYAKALALTFGSTSLAAYTVLTVYMGGMAIGAWLGGRIAENSKNPLYLYAIFEMVIGVYAVLTPEIFKLIQSVYVGISVDMPVESDVLSFVRVVLGAGALLFPTILMGATLPVMFKFLSLQGVQSRTAISNLYSANVVGAALGSLAAGYVVLPALGRNGSTYIAAVLSLLIALYAIERLKRLGGRINDAAPTVADTTQDEIHLPEAKSPLIGLSALTVLTLGGAVTLALEVVSMHMLSTIAGSSVYAFGLMLATFLGGLGLGSSVGERVFVRWSRAHIILLAQSGLAISIALTAHFWDTLPGYFGSFGLAQSNLSFAGRELVRAMVCALAMVPSAFFIGMSYSPAMALASEWIAPQSPVRGVGIASSLNTIGNISGVLIAGFCILPMLGSRLTLLVLASAAMTLSLIFVVVHLRSSLSGAGFWRGSGVYASGLAVLSLLAFPSSWNWDELASGSNVYFRSQSWGRVIEHAESVEGGITTVSLNDAGIHTLLTNGKFQGNNSKGGEMQAQASFALLPLLHTDKRESALVIGYGTGMTAHVLHEQGFKQLHVAELSRDLVRLADKYFAEINGGVASKPNVSMHIADGRNYLLTQSSRYDLISIELTSIWFAGAANLYNKDFYELARTRLNKGGVLQQWVQMHHMSEIDILYIIGSIRSVFDNVWIYYSGGQGIIVASDGPRVLENDPAHALLDQSLSGSDFEFNAKGLADRLVAGPDRVDALLSGMDPSLQLLISTDNNLFLEYSTPKGNALTYDTVPRNLELVGGKGVQP